MIVTTEKRYTHFCPYCKKEFHNNKKNQKYCSISCGTSANNFNYNDPCFFNNKIDTEEKAYVLGLFMADGSISQDKISVSQNDYELLERVKNLVNPNRILYKNKNDKNYVFMWTNKQDLNYLKSLGVTTNKSHDACIILLSDELMPHYIRGWFDGDGCIYLNKTTDKKRGYENIYKQVSITTASPNAATAFLFFLDKIGIHATCVVDSRRRDVKFPTWYVKINAISEVESFKQYIYKNATIYLNRKYQKFMI